MKHRVVHLPVLLVFFAAFASIIEGAERAYIRDLSSPSALVRKNAALSLGKCGSAACVPHLAKALKDKKPDVRQAAARSLGSLHDLRAAGALTQALKDPDENVRCAAAYALGEIKEKSAGKALLKALRDPAWCVRDQAAWALRELHDAALLAPLIELLKSDGVDTKKVTWILADLDLVGALPYLSSLLHEKDAKVRRRSLMLLGRIGGSASVGPLLTALNDPARENRLISIKALSQLRDKRAVEPLRKLAQTDGDPEVKAAAGKAALSLSQPESLAAYWDFNTKHATMIEDVTGKGIDGTRSGGSFCPGKKGTGFLCDGKSYIELGKPSGLPVMAQPFTITAWIRTDAPRGVVASRGGAWCGWCLYVKDSAARFGIHRTQEGPSYIAKGTSKVTGKWVLLAGVVREKCIEVYVNGRLEGKAETPGYIPSNCGQSMQIGCDLATTSAELMDHFEGVIDEVKVYVEALPEKTVRSRYEDEK